MDFIEYMTKWVNSEVFQARLMIGIGVLVLLSFLGIIRSDNEFLRGALIPLGLLLIVLIGYGSYILYSRPLHAKESIELYQSSSKEALAKESVKHINDNKMGKMLLRIYPILMLISILALLFISPAYYKGMAIGFALLFMSIYIIDTGFVTRSDAFLTYLKTLN